MSSPASPTLRGPPFSASLSGASGRMLSIDGVVRPVIALREGQMRGRAPAYSICERAPDGEDRAMDVAALNPVDVERADVAAAEKAFAAIPRTTDDERPPLVFLPAALSTVRRPAARRKLMKLAAAAQVDLRVAPICEIYGIEPGAPQAALREMVGLLQPIFRGVLARVDPGRRNVVQVIDCGFSGASIEAGDLSEAADPAAMLRTVLALQNVGSGVLFHSVRSVAALTAARTAGASWASLDIQSAHLAAHTETAARSPEPPSQGLTA